MNPSENFTFEKTTRGFQELLDANRYRYQKSSKVLKNGATKWLCKDSRNNMIKCKAYVILLNNRIVIHGFHLHGTTKHEAKAIQNGVIKTASENPTISSRSALCEITNLLIGSPSTSENDMTTKDSIARQIRKKRAKIQCRPMVPNDYNDLQLIPLKFQNTADNSRFLRKCEFVGQNEFLMVFCSDTGRHMLASNPD